ncbi:carbohydrate ABC transporter permease [Pleurocapsa sp. FMAR1]|uniref:carbohydrate ABC transporter permease n=1 Tax=Pleurocapsa sp. FMAR1 TaxID=3040204 RepID=UPI0029C6BE4A|nr:sugar ABC transporter permease [Pleurocapsa sp. FMAR1]
MNLQKSLIKQQKLTPYLFLLPAIALLGLTVFLPAMLAFALSFTQMYDLTQFPEWIGLANFRKLWQDKVFWQIAINTLLYLVGVVPILVIAPLGLAILVNQKLRGINWFRTAFYAPVVISMIVAGIAWKALYTQNGLLNQFLQQLGLAEGIPWLTDPKLALWSVMVVTIWKGLGYYMVIYLAGLQSISTELYEAAAIDGSDSWKKHLDITIPLMRPYLFLVAVISAISATKVFEEIYVMTKGGPGNSSKTVVYYLYDKAFGYDYDISYANTIGLVLFLSILGLSIINLKLTNN